MAQTGYTPISIYYSSTAAATPTAGNLVPGELAINTADGKLFYKDSAGVVQVIGTKGGVGSSTTTQVLYNSSGLVVGSANMTFNGTTFTLANDASISGLTVGKGGGAVASNTAVGNTALFSNTAGGTNTAVGQYAGYFVTGGGNTALGFSALSSNNTLATGSNNTAIGRESLQLNNSGNYNSALGYQSLYSNTTASNNTAVGYQAGYTTTVGNTTSVGYRAGYLSTTGGSWVAVGNESLYSNTTGSENTSIGSAALFANTTGSSNVAVGRTALFSNTTASNNTAVGYQAGYSNTTGAGSTYVGYAAGYSNTANFVTAVGQSALYTNTGAGNTAFGRVAGFSVTSGTYNTILGHQAGYSLTTGSFNTFVGAQNSIGEGCGGSITTGTKNTILGGFSGNAGGLDIRTASNYIVLSDGDGNPRGVFDGSGNLFVGVTTTGGFSTSLGGFQVSGSNGAIITGTSGTALNYRMYFVNGTAGSYATVGTIGTSGSSTIYATSSDYRLKENVAPMTSALATISALKPVTYTWKTDGSDGQGFIAHELQLVIPDAVVGEKDGVDENGNPIYQGIDTSYLVATLTASIQELNAKVEAQALEIAILKGL